MPRKSIGPSQSRPSRWTEAACQDLGIKLFVLPPRSPKLNGHVERAQRTHTEEFYQLYDGDLTVRPLNRALRQWEQVYNTIRPHQSLDGRTPAEYLATCHPQLAPPSHMYRTSRVIRLSLRGAQPLMVSLSNHVAISLRLSTCRGTIIATATRLPPPYQVRGRNDIRKTERP